MAERESEGKLGNAKSLVSVEEKLPALKREGLFSYFRNSWVEFKKVVWPTRHDAVKMTVFVVIFVGLLSAFIYAVDTAISWFFFDFLLKRG